MKIMEEIIVSEKIEADFPPSTMDGNSDNQLISSNEIETRTLENAEEDTYTLAEVPLTTSDGVAESKQPTDSTNSCVDTVKPLQHQQEDEEGVAYKEVDESMETSGDDSATPESVSISDQVGKQPQKIEDSETIEFVMGAKCWPGQVLVTKEEKGQSLKWAFLPSSNPKNDELIVWKEFPSPKTNIVNQVNE